MIAQAKAFLVGGTCFAIFMAMFVGAEIRREWRRK